MKEQVIKKRSYVRPLIEVTYVGLEHQLLAGSPVVTPKPEVVPLAKSKVENWKAQSLSIPGLLGMTDCLKK